MANERFVGVVTEFKRDTAGVTFWLVADNGARAYVESHEDRSLRNGERVAVTGERDSQGTLSATIVQALSTPQDPGTQAVQWGRVFGCSLISALICLALSWSMASHSVKPPHGVHGKSVGSVVVGNAASIFAAGIVEALFMLFLYFVLSFVTSIALTALLVSYRRMLHAALACVISVPISLFFIIVVSKLFH